jgi:hypothetical protein
LKGEANALGEVRPSSVDAVVVGRLLQPRLGACSEGGAPNGETGNEMCSAAPVAGDGDDGVDDEAAGKAERRGNEDIEDEEDDEAAADVAGREEGQESEGGG